MTRAVKLQGKASTVGFDWNDARQVLDKIREEITEIATEIDKSPVDPEGLADEVGDLLFAVANLARHLEIDPDQALRRTNAKFVRRFGQIETALTASGRDFAGTSLDEMEELWQAAKFDERKSGGG